MDRELTEGFKRWTEVGWTDAEGRGRTGERHDEEDAGRSNARSRDEDDAGRHERIRVRGDKLIDDMEKSRQAEGKCRDGAD